MKIIKIQKKASQYQNFEELTIEYMSNLERLEEYLNQSGIGCRLEGKSLEMSGYDFGTFYLQVYLSGSTIGLNKYYDNEIKDEEFSWVKNFPFQSKEDIALIFEKVKLIFIKEKKGKNI
jgi:hypothetical protein